MSNLIRSLGQAIRCVFICTGTISPGFHVTTVPDSPIYLNFTGNSFQLLLQLEASHGQPPVKHIVTIGWYLLKLHLK